MTAAENPPRTISYRWRLRHLMAAVGMYKTTELIAPPAERGITLSPSRVNRLVTGTPQRLSLTVLAALCDILGATPSELIVTSTAPSPDPGSDQVTA